MADKVVKVLGRQDDSNRMEVTAREHVFVIDQPPAAGGQDAGPTPLEYLLGSLAGCMGAIGHIVALQRKLPVRGMQVEVEGTLDLDGLLGRPTESRVGFKQFLIKVQVDADLSLEEKRAFIAEVERRCPVSENLGHTTPIEFQVS
ncbi:MAG: OsmC family protein [Candidatus Marinimicrobia bacterium]|nr:OsmC family protein [Candidatus Neomarinimicrobiota bacterium]